MMKIEPTGIIFQAKCDLKTDKCISEGPNSPVTAVWGPPGRTQINVCRPCLEEMMRLGLWEIRGARLNNFNIKEG